MGNFICLTSRKRVTGRNPRAEVVFPVSVLGPCFADRGFPPGWLRRDRRVLFRHTSTVSAVVQVSLSGGPAYFWQWRRPYRVNYERSIKKCDKLRPACD